MQNNKYVKPIAKALLPEETIEFLSLVQDQFPDGTWSYITVQNKATGTVYDIPYRKTQFQRTCRYRRFPVHRNIYVTANGFSGGGRCAEGLYSLHNIVVDIDCHTGGVLRSLIEIQQDNLIHELLHNDDEDMLLPNIIVSTGRGLQLWWMHDQLSARSNLWTWQGVVRRLCDKLESIITTSSEVPYEGCRYLKVDRAASMNAAGLFRLPGTENSAARRKACYSVVSNHRYSLQELKDFSAAHKLPSHRSTYKVVGDVSLWAKHIMELLWKLREERDAAVGSETRNNYCFVYYCMAKTAGNSHEESLDMVRRFNEGFKQPLSERQLLNAIKTAARKNYKLSIRKIVQLLGITQQEIDVFGFISPTKTAEMQRQRRLNKERRAILDKALAQELKAGKMYSEIMAKYGVTKDHLKTLYRKLGLDSTKTVRRKRWKEQAIALRKDGYTEPEIAKMIGCSRTTVQTLLREWRRAEAALAASADAGSGSFFWHGSLTEGEALCNNVYLKGEAAPLQPVADGRAGPSEASSRCPSGQPALSPCSATG